MSKQPPPAPTASAVGPSLLYPNCRTPRHWKFTQHHRTTHPLVYRSGTILAILVGSHLGNIPMKFESH